MLAMENEECFESWRMMGVRELLPFWDPDLIKLLYRIPPEFLNRGGRSKGLVRDMLARRFPHLGFERQKKVVAIDFFRSVSITHVGTPRRPKLLTRPRPTKLPPRTIAPGRRSWPSGESSLISAVLSWSQTRPVADRRS